MRNLFAIPGLLLFLLNPLFSQVGINTDNSETENSAMLDVKSSNKGFLPPRVSLTAANVASPMNTPVEGLFVYNTATSGTSPNGEIILDRKELVN